MPEITLYGFLQSNYVQSCAIACAEKGVSYTLEPIKLRSPEHLALHPFGKMPIMRHGDLVLFETAAICRYIDEAFDGPPLQPDGLIDRVRMDQWISAANDYLYRDIMRGYVMAYAFARNHAPLRADIEPALPAIAGHLGVLETAYVASPWLVAGRLTLADLLVQPMIGAFARWPEGAEMLAVRPRLGQALAVFQALDSVAAVDRPVGA